MMGTLTQIEAVKELYDKYNFTIDDNSFLIKTILSQQLLDFLSEKSLDFTLRVNERNVREGKHKKYLNELVEISINSSALICDKNIYKDWDDFLKCQKNLFNCPDFFWIISDNFLYTDKSESPLDTPDLFKNYLKVRSLLNLLIENSQYQEKSNDEVIENIIFLSKSKLVIRASYKKADLKNELDGISNILSTFKNEELYKEQKSSIFKEVLLSLLNTVPEDKRLEYLLEHFSEFSTRLTNNYELFVCEFSFDSVRSEYEEKQRDYIIKLNDIFSSVQAKMLGIPISLGVLSLKFDNLKNENVINGQFALVCGVIIYCIMMFLLIMNQFHTLKAVKDEYVSLMTRLKYKYGEQHDKIMGVKKTLDKRYLFQWCTLVLFNILTLMLLLSLFYFIPDLLINTLSFFKLCYLYVDPIVPFLQCR